MTEKTPDKSPNHNNPIFTILVIDGVADDPGLFKTFLKTEGHYVLRSDSAADALAKTKRFQPDLILLGRDIEGISYLELLPELLMEHPNVAVVMVANHPSIREAVTALKLGAVDFLELPLDLKKLKEIIGTQTNLFKTG